MLHRHWIAPAVGLIASLALAPACADDSPGLLPSLRAASQSTASSVSSFDPLPPDVGMCHICEWRPHPAVLPAPDQCGTGSDGRANMGDFSCGQEKNCDKRCDFVKCRSN